MTVAAIIVSYNRVSLLEACLRSVSRQTLLADEVIVFDNGSTDGSIQLVRENYPAFTLVRSAENLGGAGGFSRAVDLAIAKGHDLAWLMDDDSEPTEQALERLVECFFKSGLGRVGFVSPLVLQNDFTVLRSHAAETIPRESNHQLPVRSGESTTTATPYTTFVGPLVNLAVARATFLPIEAFFIWWDDTEYTARLQVLAGGVHCPEAIILHPYKKGLLDLGSRLFYDIRNRLWVIRDPRLGSDFSRQRARASFLQRLRRQVQNARSKRAYAAYVARGMAEGLMRRPAIRWPGESIGD